MKTRGQFSHIFVIASALPAMLLLGLSPAQAQATPSQDFADNVAQQTIQLVRTTACIDPSGNENTAKRSPLLKRQQELDAWLDSHGRVVNWADCKTEEDKTNYREFKDVMAGHRLLALPLKERRKRVDQVTTYFTTFKNHFLNAVEAVLSGHGQAPVAPAVRTKISTQIATHVRIDHYFFGRDPRSMIASVYLPDPNTMFLNLDFLAKKPEEFLDAFEHELWHHIIPVPDGLKIGNNIWWEGINELLSESFAYELEIRSNTLPDDLADRSIEYPVQTALMSLFLAANRTATLEFAISSISRAQLAEKLRTLQIAKFAILGKALDNAYHVSSEKKERLENLLTEWGWKEDDGEPVDIAYLLDENGNLAAEIINREFHSNRRFLMDVIQAVTVVAIQDLQTTSSDREIANFAKTLPPHLQRNLKRVLEYCHDPYYQLSQK
jgi:hypothetical protein